MTSALDGSPSEPGHGRMYGRMAAVGVAIGMVPSGLWAVFGHALVAEIDGPEFTPLSNIAATALEGLLA